MKRVSNRKLRRNLSAKPVVRSHRPRPLGVSLARYASALAVAGVLLAGVGNANAAIRYYDSDTISGNNVITGAGLGGTGSWDVGVATNWWDSVNNIDVPFANGDLAVFIGAPGTVTLGSAVTVGGIRLASTGFTIAGSGGNTLSLTPPSTAIEVVGLGSRSIISAQVAGASQLVKNGDGALVLTNTANSYSGNTLINAGTLVITDPSQLGTGNLVSVNGFANPNFTGGSLILNSGLNNVALTQNLSLSGRGMVYSPGPGGTGAFINIGATNTVSGNIAFSNGTESRIRNNYGNLTLSGNVVIPTGSAAAFTGNGNIIVSGLITGGSTGTDRFIRGGTIAGTGTAENYVGSSMWLTNTANNFISDVRIDNSNIRVTTSAVLGLASTSTTGLDLNNGTLEILTDTPDFSGRTVRVRDFASGTIFASRGLAGSGLNQTVAFGVTSAANTSTTLNVAGRDGYNFSFGNGVANFGGGGASNAIINNNSNGLLTINAPSVWNQTDGTSRTLIFGNAAANAGDILVTGNIIASSGGTGHNIQKSGPGSVTLSGTASTFAGATNVNAGTFNIGTIGVLNSTSAGRVVFGGGTLNYTGAGETWGSKVLLLNATNSILTNNGTGALVLSPNVANNSTGAKNLVLGGSNTAVNNLTGIVTNTTAGAGVIKIGNGTWQITAPGTAAAQIGTANAAFPITAVTTAGQTITTTTTAGLVVGQSVSGGGVPFGTVISQIISGTQFAISQSSAVNVATSLNIGTVTGSTAAQSVTANTGNLLTVASTANLVPGQYISGTGMASTDGWFISAINSGTTFTVSNSTGTAALSNSAAIGTANPLLSPNFGGNLTISGGTMRLNPTASGTTSDVVNNGSNLIFNVDPITANGNAGGILDYRGFTGGSQETLGALSVLAGRSIVRITPVGGTNTLTFGSLLAAPAIGSSLDFQTAGAGTNSIVITKGTTAGLLNARAYYNGADFAYTPGGANATLRAPIYGTDATFSATNTLTPATNVAVDTGASSGALAVTSLKVSGNTTLNLTGTLTVGGATGGGILFAGGSGGLGQGGGGAVTTNSAGDLVINVDGSANTATLAVPIASTTTGGLTKNGAGTLVLSGVNVQTGATTINEGKIRLATGGQLSSTQQALIIRQDGTLDLGGITPATGTNALTGSGIIENSTGTAALTVGNNNSNGYFSGLIRDNGGVLGLTKAGTGTLSLTNNASSFSGALTINAGTVAFALPGTSTTMAAGVASPLGLGSTAAALVFNNGTLQYTGSNATFQIATQTPSVTTDRQFTLAGSGTIDSSGQYGNNVLGAGAQNNAALVLTNNADLVFSGAGTRSLTLTGNSTGDNELRARLVDNSGNALSFTKAGTGLWILNPVTSNTHSGATTVSGGALQVAPQGAAVQGLSSNSNLVLSGGVLQTTGSFTMVAGTGAGQVQLTGGGFAARDSKLTVNLGGGAIVLGASPTSGSTIILNSTSAFSDVELQNDINLGTSARTIQVDDNVNTGFDFATASGVITGGVGGNLTKSGAGLLIVGGANTYAGSTTITAGTLVAQSIGATGATATSLGTNVSGGALNLNNGNIMYVGTGETVTRAINLSGTTGGGQIDNSGSGALVITSLTNQGVGAKTLTLRGTNTDANEIQSNLVDQTGPVALSVTKLDGGNWTLTGTNTFTGNLSLQGGLVLVNNAAALGAPGTGAIVFASGGLGTTGNSAVTIGRAMQIAGNQSAAFTGPNTINVTSNITGNTGNPWTINNTIAQPGALNVTGNFVSAEAATQARTLTLTGTGNYIFGGAGVLQSAGGGVNLVINTANTATTTLTGSGVNLLTGVQELRQGILVLDKANALGTASTITLAGGELRSTLVGTNTLGNTTTLNSSTAIINGTGAITFSGILNGGNGGNRTLQNDISGNPLSIATLNLSSDTNARSFTLSGSGTTNITATIGNNAGSATTNASNLLYLGSGLLNLTGTATYLGTTTLTGGTTTVSGAAGSLSTSSGITVNQSILTLDNGTNVLNNRLGSKALTLNGGTFNLLGNAAGVTEGGVTTAITTTAASTTGTVASTTGLSIGQAIYGNPNIPNGTTITAIPSATTITLSTGTGVLAGAASSNLVGNLTIGSGQSVINSSLVGGTNSSSFGTLTINTGGFVDFTGGVGTATNKVLFLTAPTLSPVTTGILARATVGGADFATYGANGIAAFTGYVTPTNVNTAAATDTLLLNATTTNGALTANKTINALAFDTGAPTVSTNGSNGVILTLTSGGILVKAGTQTLTARTALGAEGAVHVATGATLNLSGPLTGTAGLNKNLTGALNITTPQFYTGTTTLNAGTTTISGGANTIFPGQALTVNPGATLNLNGNSQFVAGFGGGNNPGTGGTITSAGAAVFSNNSSAAFGGAITGAITLNKTGSGTLTAESPLAYTGETWVTGGALTLRDNATLPNTTAINLNFATLNLDSNANLQIGNNNRVNDAAPVNSRGGTLSYTARFGAAGTETFGAFSALEGASTISNNAANNANANLNNLSTDLTFASLTRSAGATVNFTANQAMGISGNGNRLIFTTSPTTLSNGMLGGWAIANSTDFAGYNPTLGVGAIGYGGFTPYESTFGTGKITQFVNNLTPSVTSLSASETTTGALRLGGLSLNDVTFTSAANILNLESGGLLRSNQAAGSSIGGTGAAGSTANRGHLTAGGAVNAPVELVIYSANTGTTASAATGSTTTGSAVLTIPATVGIAVGQTITGTGIPTGAYVVSIDSPTQVTISQQATATATGTIAFTFGTANTIVNSVIENNTAGGVVTLVKSGAGVLNLSANNTYTGGTILNQGTVNLNGSGVIIPSGNLTLSGATLNATAAGQIATGNAVTLNDSSTLTLVGNNSLASLTFNNSGGTSNPAVTPGGVLTLTGATPFTVTSSNVLTTPTVSGTVTLTPGAKTFAIGAVAINGTTLSTIQPALNISALVNSTGSTPITKTGGGLLQFSNGGNTFYGGIDLQGGGLLVGASSTPATGGSGLTSGPFGNGAITAAAGTYFVTDATRAFGNDVAFAGTPTFDSTANTVWTLTLNGQLTGAGLAGATPTINVANPFLTVALLGKIPSIGSITGFNKTGPGALIFNSTGYTGDFNASGLGNSTSVSLLNDGDGTGSVQTIGLGNVIFDTGIVPAVTVGRAGGTTPFPTAANKILAPATISNIANGITVTNSNGYGLQDGEAITLAGTPTINVATATASNVTQGLYLTGVLGGTGFQKTGNGTVVLGNAGNTFTGTVNVRAGVVSISDNAQLGNTANTVNLNPTSGNTATLRATDNITTTRTIQLGIASDTRAIEVVNGKTLQLNSALNVTGFTSASLAKNDLGTLISNANNPTWTGAVNINQGAILVNNSALTTALGTGTISISPAAAQIGAALQLSGGVTVNNPLTLQGTANQLYGGINFGGTLESVSGTNTYSGAIAHTFDATIGARAGSTLNLTGLITASNAHRLQFNAENGATINPSGGESGVLFGFDKYGAGTLNITTAAFGGVITTGGVQVHRGLLTLSGAGTTNSSGAVNIVQSGATMRLDNTGTSTNNRLTARAVTLQGGTFDFLSNSTTELAGVLVSDQGANTINNGGSGTSSLTFASLTQNAGSSLNVTGTFGSATNFVKFTTAPALTPVTTGILNRVTTNGNEFASYNATNGIVPFTGYAAATNILSAGATQTFKATNATLNSLTGSQTLNALTLNNTAAVGGLGGLTPPTTLTLTSGSILANGTGGATLNVPIVAFAGAEGILHVASGQTLAVNSAFTGTAGLSKDLAGGVSLNTQQFVSGSHYINGGTLTLNGGNNTLLFNQAVAVNNGGTLDLNGNSQFMAGLSSAAAGVGSGVVGGTVTNSSATQSTLTINGNTNFGGVVSGNIYLNKTGTGAYNLQQPQTYTGPTLITGGTVNLTDFATLPNTAQPIEIRYGALNLSNNGASFTDLNDRVNDLAPITLIGGQLAITGRQSAASSETLGAVTLAGGQNILTTSVGTTNINSLDVTIASLTRTDNTATLRMNGSGLIGSNQRLFITTAPTLANNIIGAWAIRDRDWASYDSTYGVGNLSAVGFAGYSGVGLNSGATGTDNVQFGTAGTTTLLANTTVGTLQFNSQTTATVLNLGGNTLTIQGGGLLFGQATDSIDHSITNGTLTSGVLNSPSDFFIHHANFGGTARTVTIGANITNNGTGVVRTIFSSGQQGETVATGAVTLNGTNTYTGGTVINSGAVTLGATGTLGSGGLTVKNGIFTQTAGGIIPSQALTLGGGASVTLAGNNSLTNLTVDNNGGGAPTLNPTGVLTLTGGGGIVVTTSNAGSIANITGGTVDINGNAAYPISVGAAVVNGVDVAPWQPGLSITSNIQSTGGTGGIVKSGAGLLGLSGASTFTGGVTVSTGGLALGGNSTPSTFSGTAGVPTVVTNGPVGTGTLTLANNTTVVGTVASAISNNVTFLDSVGGLTGTGNNVFNGINNVTFNGITTLPSTWNATVTAPQMTVTIADASPSLAGDFIYKSGLGTLSVGNYAGTFVVTGGLSFTADGNTLGTPENVSLGGNVAMTGDLALTVTRAGALNARNKTLQKVNLINNGSILSVSNQNGYGLEFTGTTSLTGASHFAVGTATASNVVQGLTLSGVVSDTAGFTMVKSGAGTLALTNAGNTFGGVGATIDVLNGVLAATSDGALGNVANTVTLDVDGSTGVGFRGTGTFTTGRTFLLNQANNAFEVTAGNVLTLTTPFTLSAASNTLTKNDNGVLELSANNGTMTGAITINAGAIRLGNANAIGTGTLAINSAVGAALQLTGGVTYTNPVTFNVGASGLDSRGAIESVSGVNTVGGTITQGSGFGITIGASGGSTLNINGGITTGNSTGLNASVGSTINLNSVITGGGPGTNKFGTGTLNVTANQTGFTGALNVNQGTMNVSGAGVTLGATGLVSLNASGTLNLDDSAAATANRLGNRAVTLGGGTFNYIGNSAGSSEVSTGALTFNREGGIYNSTQTGAGNVSVTFASLAIGADSTANFQGVNLGTASNKLLFTTAPTLVPATTGLLARATVNGADFATYGATNGIAAFTAYNAASTTNINSAAATDTVDANAAMTTKNLTATKTINALRLSGGVAQTVGGAAFSQLVLTSGGVLATGATTHTLSVPVLANAAVQDIFHVNSGSTLNVTSTLTGTAGLVKDGDGALILASPANIAGIAGVNSNTLTGNTTIARGIVQLAGGTNTLNPGQFLIMGGATSTLDLNGNSQQISGLFSDATQPGTGGVITSSAGTGQLVINQDNTARAFAGTVTGAVNLVRSGQNTFTVANDNSYTGTTLINGGATNLQSDGALSGTSAIGINYASLIADNSTGLNDSTNRISDTAGITLRGGTLSLQGRAQVASTETVGTVTLAQGGSFIISTAGGTGINSADLTLAALNRTAGGGTVNFTASGLIGSNARVLINNINGTATSTAFAGLTNGIIGGWATVGTSDFATYVPGLGVAALGSVGAPQYASATILSNATGATDNVKLGTGTSNITLDTTVNAVATSNVAVGTINLSAGRTLTIGTGGLLSFTNTSWNVGSAVGQGNITSGGSELFLYTQGSGVPTINSVITGSGVTLVKTGSGTATLAATNSYGGGTTVNGGVLNVATTGTIPLATNPANGLIINNATVTLNAAGSINASNVVTLNSAGSVLNLFGDNTLAGLVLNNQGGGSGNLQINTFAQPATGPGATGVLTIGNAGIVATSSNVSSSTVIVGRVDFGATTKTIQVDPIQANGVNLAPLQNSLALQGIVGTSGGITKTGNGVLQFNAQANYTGATNVTAGGIRTGVTNAGSRSSALILGSGTSFNLNGLATTWGSLAGSGTVFNSSTTAATLTVGFNNDTTTTFAGQLARFNDAAINGVGLQKVGTGELVMTSAQNFATGTTGTITVNGGVLRYLDSGEAFNGTAASGGGTFTLNNGGTLALDNTGAANVNSRLGLDVAGTLNIQGGKLTIKGTSTAATATTEQITTFNVTNGGGRIELSPNPANPLTLAIGTLNGANGNGSLVIGGINGAASANGVANVTIATASLIGSQGTGANGTSTMAVRHDILADASPTGLGTGFLVKDSVTNNYRALGTDSTGAAAPGELSSALTATTGTQNVLASTGSSPAITSNAVANTLTLSGTGSVSSGLNATAFGSYGPNGGLLTLSLSQAAASLTLNGASATINTGAFGSTTAGTTPYVHVVGTGVLDVNAAFAVNGTAGLLKADDGTLNLNRPAYYTGTTTVNGGTLNLNSGAANTIAALPTAGGATLSQLNVNGTNAIVDLKGQNQALAALTSINPLPGMGGTVTNTGAASTLTVVGALNTTNTFSGQITGNIAFTRAGTSSAAATPSVTILTNANTYTGATTVRGGTLQLRDSGSISSTAGLNLNYGTLNWDNFGLNPNGNANPTRVSASNPVALQGGTFTINGAGSTDTTATLNSVTLAGGSSTVNVLPYINEGSTVKLTIGTLSRDNTSHSGINFNGFTTNNSSGASGLGGQGLTQNGQVIVNSVSANVANAVTTAGSNIVTVPSTSGLLVGGTVTGTGIPANERITAITGPTTFTITTGTGVTAQASTTLAANSPILNLLLNNAVTTTSSATVTVPSTAGLVVGAPVTGTGIPANEFITAITGPTTFTMTTGTGVTAQAATALTFNTLTNNLIGGWAVADGNTFATYVSGNGVLGNNGISSMGATTQGIVAPNFTGTDVSAALVTTGNYSDGSSRTLVAGAQTANSLRFVPGAAQTITLPTASSLALNVGIITNAAFQTTIAATDATSTMSGTGTDLYFYVNQNVLQINPAITGSAALVSNGGATLRLAPQFASNTYTGGTFVQNGTLNLQATSPFIAIPGALTITNSAVTMSTTTNQIASTSAVTINAGGSLTLANYTTGPTQTLDSVTFTNEGGTANPTLSLGTPTTATSTLILSSATPITAGNNSLSTTPTISTGAAALTALQFSSANPVITVNSGLGLTGLTISAPITQNASMTGPLAKAGTGALDLSGANTFTTGFNLNAGSLIFGANSAGTPPTVTSGPVGTGALSIAGGTTLLSDAAIRTIGNATTVNGDFTFGGVTSINGVILSGAMNLGATGRTITVTSPAVTSTISGAITSTATGTALTKAGAGTLVLSSAASSLGGAAVAVTGGVLKNGVINALPVASGLAVSAGSGYDLNGFAQTLDVVSGTGFITNSANSSQTLTIGSAVNDSTFDGILTDNRLAQTSSALALTKTLGSTLTLTSANTYNGATSIAAGVLRINNGSALGTTVGSTTIVGNTSTGRLELIGNIVVAEPITIEGRQGAAIDAVALSSVSGNNTISSQLTGSSGGSDWNIESQAGTLTLSGGLTTAQTGTRTVKLSGAGNGLVSGAILNGTATTGVVKNSSGTWTLGGANTYAGPTTVNAGILSITNNTGLGTTVGGTTVVSGASLELQGNITVGAEALNITGTGSATNGALRNLSGTNIYGGTVTVGTGGATVTSDAGLLTLSAANSVTGASQDLTVNGAGNVTIAGTITTAAGGLTKTGSGTLNLQGASTYSGITNINSGIVNVSNSAGLGSAAGATNVATNATLQLSNNISVGAEGLTLNGGNAAGQSGALVNLSGTNTYGGVVTVAANSTIAAATGSTLNLTGGIVKNGTTATLSGGGSINVSSAITGGLPNSDLVVNGGTSVKLSANNSYTGPTTVTGAGTSLEISGVNGQISGTTSVSVTSGGTLLLSGSNADRINDSAPVSLNGGTIAFGGSVYGASETVGALTLSGNSTLDFGSSSTSPSQAGNTFIFGSGVTFGSGATLSIYNWSGSAYLIGQPDTGTANTNPDTQDRLIFGAPGSGLSNSDLGSIRFYSDNGGTLLGTGNEISFGSSFEIVPVPEPSSTALLGAMGLLGLVGYRERRRFGRKQKGSANA